MYTLFKLREMGWSDVITIYLAATGVLNCEHLKFQLENHINHTSTQST